MPSRDVRRTQRRRPAAGRMLVTSGSGARGFDADSWGAGHGGDGVGRADRYAARRPERLLGCGGRTSCDGRVDTARGAREDRVCVFLADSESPSPKKMLLRAYQIKRLCVCVCKKSY
jgi:hypothetical protein